MAMTRARVSDPAHPWRLVTERCPDVNCQWAARVLTCVVNIAGLRCPRCGGPIETRGFVVPDDHPMTAQAEVDMMPEYLTERLIRKDN